MLSFLLNRQQSVSNTQSSLVYLPSYLLFLCSSFVLLAQNFNLMSFLFSLKNFGWHFSYCKLADNKLNFFSENVLILVSSLRDSFMIEIFFYTFSFMISLFSRFIYFTRKKPSSVSLLPCIFFISYVSVEIYLYVCFLPY